MDVDAVGDLAGRADHHVVDGGDVEPQVLEARGVAACPADGSRLSR